MRVQNNPFFLKKNPIFTKTITNKDLFEQLQQNTCR